MDGKLIKLFILFGEKFGHCYFVQPNPDEPILNDPLSISEGGGEDIGLDPKVL